MNSVQASVIAVLLLIFAIVEGQALFRHRQDWQAKRDQAEALLDEAREHLHPLPLLDAAPATGHVSTGILAPSLTGVAHDGLGYSTDSMRGAPTLVIFFRTWGDEEKWGFASQSSGYNTPLVEEWKKLHLGLSPRGLNVLGAVTEGLGSASKFAANYHVRFPIISTVENRYQVAWRTSGSGNPLPLAFLIDKRGQMMAGHRPLPGPPPLVTGLRQRLYGDTHTFAGTASEVMRLLANRYIEYRHMRPGRISGLALGGLSGASTLDDPFFNAVRQLVPGAAVIRPALAQGRSRSLFSARDTADKHLAWVRSIEVSSDGQPTGELAHALIVVQEGRVVKTFQVDGPVALKTYLEHLEGHALTDQAPELPANVPEKFRGGCIEIANWLLDTRDTISLCRSDR